MINKTHNKIIRYVGTLLALLIFLVISVFLLTPAIIKYAYSDWLSQQGLEGEIGDIRIDLGDGRINFSNVSIVREGKKAFNLRKLLLQIHLRDLWENKITIENLMLEGLDLMVKGDAQALIVAGLPMGKGNEETPQAAPVAGDTPTPWEITVANIGLSEISACYSSLAEAGKNIQLCQLIGSLVWDGRAAYRTTSPSDEAISANGSLMIGNVSLTDELISRRLFSLGALRVENAAVNSVKDIRFDKVSMVDYAAIEEEAVEGRPGHLVQWNDLSLENISLENTNELSINKANLTGLAGFIKINKDNALPSVSYINSFLPEKSSENQAGQENKSPFIFKIGQIALEANQSTFIEDGTVQPTAVHNISKHKINIENINNADQESVSKFVVDLGVDDYGEIKLSGTGKLFADKPSFDLSGDIKAINLTELSSYSKEFLQHRIKSGQLNTKSDIKVMDGQVDSKTVLDLYKFYPEKLDEKQADKYEKGLGIPLAAALLLLRDRDDNINIELPISGDVNSPDFSLNDIITTVLIKAIREAVLTYYLSFGLVAVVANTAIDLATALRFDPVIFDLNNAELDDQDRSQLDALAVMMIERPGIRLVVCGHANQEDRFMLFPAKPEELKKLAEAGGKAGNEQSENSAEKDFSKLTEKQLKSLNALALQRAESIKAYLVKIKNIGADRLILCSPEYVPGETNPPYVEITI